MNKPYLIVITGRPASGKTTLAHILSTQLNFPLLSRDEFKEGYINTTGIPHNPLDNSVDKYVYETFFQTIDLLITCRISIIIEAAFQHKLWKPELSDYLARANVRIIICEIIPDLAKTRFINRLLKDPGRKTFHGDDSVFSKNPKIASLIEAYENVSIEAPILHVNTADNYDPDIGRIIDFIKLRDIG